MSMTNFTYFVKIFYKKFYIFGSQMCAHMTAWTNDNILSSVELCVHVVFMCICYM